MNIRKAQYANDIFTTEAEAVSRSMDLGLGGVTHVSDYNGQAVFMPAESHRAYLAFYEQGEATEEPEAPSVDRIEPSGNFNQRGGTSLRQCRSLPPRIFTAISTNALVPIRAFVVSKSSCG